MVYAQLDNRFHDHPKVIALLDHDNGMAAIGLWTLCITWAHSHADPAFPDDAGRIPSSLPRRLGGGEDLAKLLVAVGLWEATPDGWMIHDFGGRQSLASWQARSDKARTAAQARWGCSEHAPSNAPSNAQSNAHNPPPAPPQYRTEQKEERSAQETLWAGFNADGDQIVTPETDSREKKTRGTRLPEDWAPSPALRAWAHSEYPSVNAGDQTERFRDYWLAKAGASARHVSWDLTWKNWIRRAGDYSQPRRTTAERWD